MKKSDIILIMVSKVGKFLLLAGSSCVLLTAIAFVATAVYESIVPPTDMHLPGLLTACLMVYLAPVGGIAIIVGGLLSISVLFIRHKE